MSGAVEGLNEAYATSLLYDYLENPEAVPEEWRTVLAYRVAGREGPFAQPASAAAQPPEAPPEQHPAAVAPSQIERAREVETDLLAAVAAATALVDAFRMHGHLAARLDPLGSEPIGDPALELGRLEPELTPDFLRRIPAALLGLYVPGATLADALPELRATYCGTLAYEIEHISDHDERVWLRRAIESGEFRGPLGAETQRRLLERLSEVEAFEQYLRRAFLGQKQFSIEGLDALVPMLDEAIELAARDGAHEVVMGMAHRGRLSVLAHTVAQPYEAILREFEGERTIDAIVGSPEGGTGDVKYHLGAAGVRHTGSGDIAVTLVSNPSHLEAVNPVVEGWTRAEQTDRSAGPGLHDPSVALPILLHGDASFAGQGVVAETFNLEGLAGYSTGGTLHVIANNQVGFTTDPVEGRSTRHSSDLAKGFDAPIVHVNADDPEAAIAAVRLALAFRQRFGHDVVVDLVGYRRFGHNEQDEPAYTQPLMAIQIAQHPTVRATYASALTAQGVVTAVEAEEMVERATAALREAHEGLRQQLTEARDREPSPKPGRTSDVLTAVPANRLRTLDRALVAAPEGFSLSLKLARQLERRGEAIDGGGIDWGHAEALALGSLVQEGIPVRLTGQDTERGTFSHRHLVFHDAATGERYAPIQHLSDAQAAFEVHNSPLSEYGALGFEYGYSVAAPEALVVWEAQFGDFVNVAQVIVDQFLVSGLSKWGQTSRLTLLLPHGYEGNGPEHSSARLERFLQSAAQENVRVATPSTAAQYFHLLRRQALDARPRPLVAMTPKGLLRLKESSARLEELAAGSFAPVLDDARADHERVRRLVFCSGKVFYDIEGHEAWGTGDTAAVVRLEQLYPFPARAVSEVIAAYPNLAEMVWAQEEPLNMGAYRSIRHRLEDALPAAVPLRYVGRPWRASPSEGYPTAHLAEQDRIAREAIGG
jgi:2-oxoglutarate dehydrogenase E1 component